MTGFKDNFSKQAQAYSKYRPHYPAELFDYLGSLTSAHELAWDCGTGNGQSAMGLTRHYKTVYATDPSAAQIKNAQLHAQIVYKIEPAEQPSLPDNSVDLVTIAQALHWFDFTRFYSAVNRVLKPGGIIAAWAYGLPVISNEIDALVRHFHDHIVGDFWQPENRLIDTGYSTLPFPFKALSPPRFIIPCSLSLPELAGLISSWSAVQKYIDKTGKDPVLNLAKELAGLWQDPSAKKELHWELILKVGQTAGRA